MQILYLKSLAFYFRSKNVLGMFIVANMLFSQTSVSACCFHNNRSAITLTTLVISCSLYVALSTEGTAKKPCQCVICFCQSGCSWPFIWPVTLITAAGCTSALSTRLHMGSALIAVWTCQEVIRLSAQLYCGWKLFYMTTNSHKSAQTHSFMHFWQAFW